MSTKEQIKQRPDFEDVESRVRGNEHYLILHNDDVHTFDYVIASLVDICNHEVHQAEQCAYIVHHKGKCEVKKGTYAVLRPMKEKLAEKGLSVTID
jgi:ATP-dependent Clp protease adaptor protein ClpS